MEKIKCEEIIDSFEESDDCYFIKTKEHSCFSLEKKFGVVPKYNDNVTIYSVDHKFGEICGIVINDQVVFDKTLDEVQKERDILSEKIKKEKEEHFLNNKENMDKIYENLPDVFKKRIDRFRRNNPSFRVNYEEYELFCCTEAVKIADKLKTPGLIYEFGMKEPDEQRKLIPELSNNHSGNTFGMSWILAYIYTSEPYNVPKVHGSLSTLVGSEEYGDIDKE